jgi:hypothetical protein
MAVPNILAYYDAAIITNLKSYTLQAPEQSDHKTIGKVETKVS